MAIRKTLDRRTLLKGAGVALGLPFLEAMLPPLAWAAPKTPRLVSVYGGAPAFLGKSLPPTGALGATLPNAIAALAPVRQHVSLLSGMALPQYVQGTTPPPAGCVQRQHGNVPAPYLAGMPSMDAKPMLHQCHTVDQIWADAYGATNRFKSIQARVQLAGYLYGPTSGIVSSRFENGILSTQAPEASPLALYNKLFSAGVGGGTPPALTPAQLNKKSVLDLVLGDANRLSASLSGADKARLDQHFQQIREIEKSIAGGAGATGPVSGQCAVPTKPGADPATTIGSAGVINSWSNETLRGDVMADLLAMALACDLTRSISWQLTWDQCGMTSSVISGVNSDLHAISHDVSNDTTGSLKTAMEKQYNWHCARFARIVANLAAMSDGAGTVLDSTFLAMGTGEGVSAHNRSQMAVIIAGNGSAVKLGQHIATGGEHPGRVLVAGMQSLGRTNATLGQLTSGYAGMLK
jgi:hypothetical protein